MSLNCVYFCAVLQVSSVDGNIFIRKINCLGEQLHIFYQQLNEILVANSLKTSDWQGFEWQS